jgi:uncharacterized membrane protein
MRLRPSPLIESSATFALSFLLVIGYYWVSTGNLNSAFNFATASALFFMFPVFSAWSFVGLLVKNRVIKQRFLINLGINTVITGGLALFLLWVMSNSEAGVNPTGAATMVVSAFVVGLANLISAVVTYRFVLDDNKTKLSSTAYTTINTGPQAQPKGKATAPRKKK